MKNKIILLVAFVLLIANVNAACSKFYIEGSYYVQNDTNGTVTFCDEADVNSFRNSYNQALGDLNSINAQNLTLSQDNNTLKLQLNKAITDLAKITLAIPDLAAKNTELTNKTSELEERLSVANVSAGDYKAKYEAEQEKNSELELKLQTSIDGMKNDVFSVKEQVTTQTQALIDVKNGQEMHGLALQQTKDSVSSQTLEIIGLAIILIAVGIAMFLFHRKTNTNFKTLKDAYNDQATVLGNVVVFLNDMKGKIMEGNDKRQQKIEQLQKEIEAKRKEIMATQAGTKKKEIKLPEQKETEEVVETVQEK